MVLSTLDFVMALRVGVRIASKIRYLMLLNVIAGLAEIHVLKRILSLKGFYFGISFTLPHPVHDIWDFVSLPGEGIRIYTMYITPMATWLLMVYITLSIIIDSILSFIYLTTVSRNMGVGGRWGFGRLLDIMIYMAFITMIGIMIVVTGLASTASMIPSMAAFFIICYLTYGTPYIIVIRDTDFFTAIMHCMKKAFTSKYFVYTLAYMILTGVVSIPTTLIVVNGGFIGFIICLFPISMLGLVLTIATVWYFKRWVIV